jgi:hypothetical protein
MLQFRIYNTIQVKSVFQCMNLKRKLLQCNANIKFNKTCLAENIVPKYAEIKVLGNTAASKNTKHKAQRIRIQNEIKYLF